MIGRCFLEADRPCGEDVGENAESLETGENRRIVPDYFLEVSARVSAETQPRPCPPEIYKARPMTLSYRDCGVVRSTVSVPSCYRTHAWSGMKPQTGLYS